MKRNFSLKHQMLVSNILIFVLPALILGYVTISTFNERTKENIQTNNIIIATHVNNQIESFIQGPINVMSEVREVLLKKEFIEENEINTYLNTISNVYSYFDTIRIIDKKGIITNIAPYNKDLIGTSMLYEDFFNNIDTTGKPIWSKVYISNQTHKPTVNISMYIDGDIVVGNLNLSKLTEIIEGIPVEKEWYISIIDQNGVYIVDKKNNDNVSQRRVFDFLDDVKEGIEQNKAMINVHSNGDLMLYSTKIKLTGWYSVIVIEGNKIFEPVDKFKNIFYVGLGIFLIISFAISIININIITKSLKNLIYKTKRISSGDYSIDTDTKGYKECIELSNNFDIMKERIKEREDRIQALNGELEDKVIERTAQLNEINCELEETNAVLEEEIFERQEAEEEVRKLNDSLEYKVKERTSQLAELNRVLDKSNTLLRAILESSPEVIMFALDTNYCYLTFNKKHKEIMYAIWGKEIKLGMNMLEVIGKHEDYYKAKENFDRVLEGQSFIMIEEYGDEKYSRLFWQDYWSPILAIDGKVIGITCFVMNITEQKSAEAEMLYLSYHDQLTGLHNRRFYEEELRRLDNENNLPLTIVMADVNGLKLVNDSFGHSVGDELLKKVGQVIKRGCREKDTVARLSGDEFVILLPKTDIYETEEIVRNIKELALKEKIGAIDLSISFGYETKKNKEEIIQEIFKKAEDYMYKKKLFESPSMRGKTINAIINTLHEKNKREEQHSHRVSELCQSIGKALGLQEGQIEELKTVGLLHDIGKIAINENILNKPGKLTQEEFEEIRRHPEIGYRILSTVNDMSEMAEYVLAHHERWDGKGYPKGLKGCEIPIQARIIAIVDAYDAMTSERSYRSALPEEITIEELKRNAGIQFDPELIKIFIEIVLQKPLE